ncbi:hypothetical protein CsSME_00042491 [Camellia sinensis var. sinensis]
MEDELSALQKTSTWKLVPLPAGKNLVGCKWVYKVKAHYDGSLEHYKGYGIDYEETFVSVAKMTTIRTLITVAVVRSWPLYQMDVKNAFLNSHLTEEDSALFLLHTSAGFFALLLYVDDMIITGSDSSVISEVKQHLFRTFDMKNLGPLRYFLDDSTLYRELVGCLVYLTVIRPNLAYAVHVVSQFVFAHRSTHWAALVRILRYLRGTIFQDLLLFSTSSLDLVDYANSDWAGDVTNCKSTSGFCMFFGGSLISWENKK